MIELKPCPFCGREAEIIAETKRNIGFTIWCECKECSARTEGYCPNMENPAHAIKSIERCKEKAIESWNRRTNDEVD